MPNDIEFLAERIEFVSIDSLVPHPERYNRGDADAVRASMAQLGVYKPLLVQQETNYILSGHTCYEVLKDAGATFVQVIFLDVEPEDALRILVNDNESARLAEPDVDVQEAVLIRLRDTPRGLLGTGWDLDRLAELQAHEPKPRPTPQPRHADDQTRVLPVELLTARHARLVAMLDDLVPSVHDTYSDAVFAAVEVMHRAHALAA